MGGGEREGTKYYFLAREIMWDKLVEKSCSAPSMHFAALIKMSFLSRSVGKDHLEKDGMLAHPMQPHAKRADTWFLSAVHKSK